MGGDLATTSRVRAAASPRSLLPDHILVTFFYFLPFPTLCSCSSLFSLPSFPPVVRGPIRYTPQDPNERPDASAILEIPEIREALLPQNSLSQFHQFETLLD
jgi:hypothetical protein